MIAYHGTPLGDVGPDLGRFFTGRHALVPFLGQDDLACVGAFASSFVLDNSAYSAWRRGAAVDFDAYTAWCATMARHPRLDWCLIPDVIGGTADENDAMLRAWPASMRHLGVPVYHLHEDVGRLDALVSSWPRVALGSSGEYDPPASRIWWARMRQVLRVACDDQGRPRARLHGLRMLAPEITARVPLTSADSTTAARQGGMIRRFGTHASPKRVQRSIVVADILEMVSPPAVWHPSLTDGDLFADMDEGEPPRDDT